MLLLIVMGSLMILVVAQAPQAFKYQAVIRDKAGQVLSNQNVSLQVSILQSSVDGPEIYRELHSVTTNELGLVSIEIGKGKNPTGSLSAIDWGAGSHFLKLEMDMEGGINFELMGVSQLLSVPYALYAEKAGSGMREADLDWEVIGNDVVTGHGGSYPTGNVGIGNNAPGSLLYVAKNTGEPTITIRNLGGSGGATYSMVDDLSGANWKFKATMYGGFKIRDQANSRDVFSIEPNSDANALYIKSGGNVGVGTNAPDSSAALDVSSSSKGFLPPRMTAIERDNIENPAVGLMIYNLDCQCINFFNGANWVSYGQDPNLDFECGGQLTDVRDDKTYSTVQIGDQCWMAENLNLGTRIDGDQDQTDNDILEKYCYDDIPANCSQYGALYQWNEMMGYDTNRFNTGICPDGWRLPTAAEWDSLVILLGGESVAGYELKENGTTGFEALLGGERSDDGNYADINIKGYFWTASQVNNTQATYRYLTGGNAGFLQSNALKTNGMAVRCIKGLPTRIDSMVVVIDSMTYQLLSDSAELAQGIYRYELLRRPDETIITKNIIVGLTDEGYLRKVDSVFQNRGELTLHTSDATLEDMYEITEQKPETGLIPGEDGKILKIKTFIDGLTLVLTQNGIKCEFDDVIIYQDDDDDPKLTLKVSDGYVLFEPNFVLQFDIENRDLKRFEFGTDDAVWEESYSFNLEVSDEFQLDEPIDITIARYKAKIIIPTVVPIVLVFEFDLKAVYDFTVGGEFIAGLDYTKSNRMTFKMTYENNHWRKDFNITKSTSVDPFIEGQVGIHQELKFVPEISVKLYGAVGPYFNTPLYENFDLNMNMIEGDWDAGFKVGVSGNLGVKAKVLGKKIFNVSFPKLFGYEKYLWNVPDKLVYISGDNQTGLTGEQLVDPLQIKVVDNLNLLWPMIPVHFDVTDGGGTVSQETVTTGINGIAQTNWTLGPNEGENTLEASVVRADGTHVNNSPVIFSANTEDNPSNLPFEDCFESGDFTVSDWTVTGNATISNQSPAEGIYCVRGLTNWGIKKDIYSITDNIVTIEYFMKASQINKNCVTFSLFDASGNESTRVHYRHTGYIIAYDGTQITNLMTYISNTWYSMKIILDMNTKTYDVFIDGQQKANDFDFVSSEFLFPYRFHWYSGEDYNSIGWIDCVRIYPNTLR